MEKLIQLKYEDSDIAELFLDDIVRDICATQAFRRLKGISFLGAIDFEPMFSKRKHNRFNHSIGVALLAQHYATRLEFSEGQRIQIVLAALLHDIGHAPLSHSLEPLFNERFGLNHHIATNRLLLGENDLGKGISLILSKNKIDAMELIQLMSGLDDSEKGCIFSSPINIDTIEAIWRGGTYFCKQFSNPVSVLDAFIEKKFTNNSIIDTFWEEKNTFYKLMIYSELGVAADHWARLQVISAKTALEKNDFFMSEKEFKIKYFCNSHKNKSEIVNIKERIFQIDREKSVFSYENLKERYTIEKNIKVVSIEPPRKNIIEKEPLKLF